jgi:plasmid stabilization system protein ParE
MKLKKIVYSAIALSKRKAIKKEIKEKYGKYNADMFSKKVSQTIAGLKRFPEMGISMREKYGLDCDYYMFYIEHNYFVYRVTEDMIVILEIFNEKEDFMYQLFGKIMTSQDTVDYWGEE